MKRSIAILLASLILMSACAQQKTEKAHKTKQIGILMFGDSRLPQSQGFIDGLKSFGWEKGKNIEIKMLNAKNNKGNLAPMTQSLIDTGTDLLVAAGGLEADAIKANPNSKLKDTVVLYINAIMERKLIRDRRSPGWEITGVDNLNYELSGKRVELLHEINPAYKKILLLYYPEIAPSRLGMENARKQADNLGLTIVAREVHSRDEIKSIMESLKPGDVDAMLTVPTAPIDNAIKDIILPVTKRLSIPLMTHSRHMVEMGALASYGAPTYNMGKQAARLADKIFKGAKTSSMPFETPNSFKFSINKSELEHLSLTLSNLAASQVNEYID